MLTYRESHPEDAEQSCESKGKEQRKWGSFDEHQEISPAQEDETNWKEVNKDLAELFQTLGLESSSQMSDACAKVRNITSDCLVFITRDFNLFLVMSNICIIYSGGDTADITSRR